MVWALEIPKRALSDSSARHVLLCLANYAGSDGRGAFPAASTLAEDTGLSERTVRYKLDLLRESGWITRGNQALAAVYIDQTDRRPVVYDLPLTRGADPAPRPDRGANDAAGCNLQQSGVQISTERGAESAPNTSFNRPLTEEQQQREIQDAIAEQNRQALEPDDRQRFSMFADWQPDSRQLIAQAQIAGVKPADISDSVIRTFKGYYVARQSVVENAASWCHRLVNWFRRERAKTAGTEPDFDSNEWANDLGDL